MKYKSEIYEVMHQDAIADFEVGAISETRMREYDEMCLVQESETVSETEKPTAVKRHATA
jgi:putative transcriptional regulator